VAKITQNINKILNITTTTITTTITTTTIIIIIIIIIMMMMMMMIIIIINGKLLIVVKKPCGVLIFSEVQTWAERFRTRSDTNVDYNVGLDPYKNCLQVERESRWAFVS